MKHFKSLIQKIKNPIVRKQQQGFFRTLFLFLPIILNAEHLEKQDLRVTVIPSFFFCFLNIQILKKRKIKIKTKNGSNIKQRFNKQ